MLQCMLHHIKNVYLTQHMKLELKHQSLPRVPYVIKELQLRSVVMPLEVLSLYPA